MGIIEKKIAFAGPWIGEFGWEIMTWIPYLRKRSRDYEKMFVSTFEGMEPLYIGFHCEVEFKPHDYNERVDDWTTRGMMPCSVDTTDIIKPIKEYRVDGEYVRYGSPVIKDVSVLFHARGIEKGSFKNWDIEKWEALAEKFPGAASIGTRDDLHVPGTVDGRDIAFHGNLRDVIASASIVIGQSSGVMHLASMCGTPHLVWGDDRLKNFGESLEKRYAETWNPFGTPVTWVSCEKPWDPEVDQILDALRPKSIPDPRTLDLVKRAVESEHYTIAVAYMGEKDGKDALYAQAGGTGFPDAWLDKAEKDLLDTVKGSISTARAERRPVSWQ